MSITNDEAVNIHAVSPGLRPACCAEARAGYRRPANADPRKPNA